MQRSEGRYVSHVIQAEPDSQGQPGLMGPPVSQLQGDFPLRPECMGNLVPQSINMWMGAASEGRLLWSTTELLQCC